MKLLWTILTWPFRAGYRFWTTPTRAEPLALFRILLGICLLLNLWITIIPVADLLVGPDGLCKAEAADAYLKRTKRICLLRGPISIPYLDEHLPKPWAKAWAEWGATPQAAYTLFAAMSVSAVFMTVGLFTRMATIVTWLLCMTLHQRLSWCMNGGDAVARMALFYLIFARSGAVWSLDHWWARRRRPHDPTLVTPMIPVWPLRLMQIQICLVYLFTGVIKLGEGVLTGQPLESDWINGEALYWLYNDLELTRWPYSWTPFPLWLCRIMTWSVMVFEIGFAFLVPFRWLRPWVLLYGVLLHLGIWLHTEIAFFSQYMLCWYVLFLSGERLSAWMSWLGRRFRRHPTTTAQDPPREMLPPDATTMKPPPQAVSV